MSDITDRTRSEASPGVEAVVPGHALASHIPISQRSTYIGCTLLAAAIHPVRTPQHSSSAGSHSEGLTRVIISIDGTWKIASGIVK